MGQYLNNAILVILNLKKLALKESILINQIFQIVNGIKCILMNYLP